ncbi:SusF/SusE family outer membrane protein [Bacteroides sedimenti]|uniref:Outer membrane protein SusE n=1 Tax=Bacteroides sedimenti TaxID=2136147 RepID=A0ABM8IEL0_9BACE
MKKITILASLFLGLSLFTACDSDRDSNPILQDPTTFVLNTPAYSTSEYDLEKSKSIELTCSQPDYGFTAATIYSVQISLNNDFKTEGAFADLATTYTTAKMNVDASEVAVAATNLALAEGKTEADFPLITKVYVRLKAALTNGMGAIYSNPVTLSNVRVHFALPPVLLPTAMNIIGGGIGGWDWNANALEMVPTFDNNGTFWRIIYVTEGGEIKFNSVKDWNGGEFGTSATLVDNADAGLGGDGNISVANAGWYLVVVKSTLVGRNINYTVEFNAPKVYMMGNTVGGWDIKDENSFTVPADGTGFFVSRPLDATDEVRMCVKLTDLDWWKTEFIVLADGKISYRGTGPDQERYKVDAGKRVYLNFMTGKGKYE